MISNGKLSQTVRVRICFFLLIKPTAGCHEPNGCSDADKVLCDVDLHVECD